MGLVIKAALGALVVLLIGVLAKTKNYYIAGLIPRFSLITIPVPGLRKAKDYFYEA